MTKELNLPAQRDIVMEMVCNLAYSLLSAEDPALSKDTEDRLVEIYAALSYALQIPKGESV